MDEHQSGTEAQALIPETRSQVLSNAHISERSKESIGEKEERTNYQKCQHILKTILDYKYFMAFEIGFVLLSLLEQIAIPPKIDPALN